MSKKIKFLTEYERKGKKYSSSLKAKTWKEAEKLLKERKETEKVIGYID